MRLSIAIPLCVALAPLAAFAQAGNPEDSGPAAMNAGQASNNPGQKGNPDHGRPDIINVGATGEANGYPFGRFPRQDRYRQYYSPAGFNSNKQLQIEAVAFTSDPYPGGVGPLMLNVTVSLGVAHTLVPPASLDLPLEDVQVCFNGPLTTFLNGRPEDLRFPCMRSYHYHPGKGDILVVDVVVHHRVESFDAGFLFGWSPNVTRVYQNAADGVVMVEPGEGLFTTFEVK